MEKLPGQPRNEAEVFAETHALWSELMTGPHMMEANEEMADFAEYLRKKYPGREGALGYTLYHLLAGSSMMSQDVPAGFDFPGDDSVEMFLKALKIELQGK
jgi:hypothetical protein